MIKAPAGFGKTSLAAAWLQQLQQSGNAVAWLTIDPDDDEPTTFLFYVSHALQRACEVVGAAAIDLIQESFLINPRAIVSTLINDLSDVDDEIYLFLEDYHWITNPDIHEALSFFLSHAPSHCHVVLTTRTEPPLPLASLRAQNQLLEIDASALRFDLQETRNFLEIERPGTLVPSDVRLLHEKTEGWPAALRIVASTSTQLRQDFGQYVRNLSGTQRPIGAYLEELLDGLPRDMVQFMLRTAVLDRLCAPLCEAVTGASSSQELLGSIEKPSIAACATRSGRPVVSLPSAACRILEPEIAVGAWQRDSRAASTRISLVCIARIMDGSRPTCDRGGRCSSSAELDRKLLRCPWSSGVIFSPCLAGNVFSRAALMRSQPEVRLAIAWGMALAVRYDESLELAA